MPSRLGLDATVTKAPFRWLDALFAVALLAAVLLAYQPAWQGGFLWDDDQHITAGHLRSWDGLRRIWLEPGATIQYFPLLQSAFWVEHRLWGDATLGYHLLNIVLHVSSALLVALILRQLAVPGAWLAAAIFALHPVHVESVAWMSEQKNTLSAVFYLGAMLAYLPFDRARRWPRYLAALGLFALAVFSKSVTATLPAALLVVFWWQRGRLSWKKDVLPLVPFFALGATVSLFTAWFERKLVGAEGTAFALTWLERCLLAGRVVWFYLGKLFWPADLIFTYPRWSISQAVWWQYVFPVAALLLLGAFWALRRRCRGPLAALLYFGGTLFPVLGFVNVYPFIFSFVADHFQYLASLGIITLSSACAALLLDRWRLWGRPAGYALCLTLLATLAGLTWRQSRMYAKVETFYHTTIDRNPDSWMAHNNLGLVLADTSRVDEAIDHFRTALSIWPDYPDAHNNLGKTFSDRGQVDEAIDYFRKALGTKPDFALAHNNLGLALLKRGQVDEAIDHLRQAVAIQADLAGAQLNLGNALLLRGRADDAIAHYQTALKFNPDDADAHSNLGAVLARRGQVDEAIDHYHEALRIRPGFADAHCNLAAALAGRGRVDEAIAHYRRALETRPDDELACNSLGNALLSKGQANEAIAYYQKAVTIKPGYVDAHCNLGLALAGLGIRDQAIAHYQQALRLAIAQGNNALTDAIRARIRLLQSGAPAGGPP